MTTDEIKLRPCPFCGRQPEVGVLGEVFCHSCDWEDGGYWPKPVSVWNTRPIEDQQAAEIGRLNAYADKLADGLPEGMLPKDIELMRGANAKMAEELERLRNRTPGGLALTALGAKMEAESGRELIAVMEKEIERLREATRWIPVSERLPENAAGCRFTSDFVLVYCVANEGEPFETVACYNHHKNSWSEAYSEFLEGAITHWMPLPEPPNDTH